MCVYENVSQKFIIIEKKEDVLEHLQVLKDLYEKLFKKPFSLISGLIKLLTYRIRDVGHHQHLTAKYQHTISIKSIDVIDKLVNREPFIK